MTKKERIEENRRRDVLAETLGISTEEITFGLFKEHTFVNWHKAKSPDYEDVEEYEVLTDEEANTLADQIVKEAEFDNTVHKLSRTQILSGLEIEIKLKDGLFAYRVF